MLTSYSYNVSKGCLTGYSCAVCLNGLKPITSTKWQVLCLSGCGHLMHEACLEAWSSHSKELAKRDASISYQETCPLCKIGIEGRRIHYMHSDGRLTDNKAEVNPDRPLHSLENPDPDSGCDVQSLQGIFDKAVTFENSPLYYDLSNFPALHQMKNRYGMTLNAEQLQKIMNGALVTTAYWDSKKKLEVSLDSAAASQIRMAMFLRSDDDASREVINEFFIKTLGFEKGQRSSVKCKDIVIDFLIEHVITDKEVLQKGFDYYIKQRNFHNAAKLHKKCHCHIEHEALKQALTGGSICDHTIGLLSQIASNEGLQRAALDALKVLNETMPPPSRYEAKLTRISITALLDTGIRDQAEINNTLRLAVLIDDSGWQKELKNQYGAVLDSQFFKDHLEKAKDSDLATTIETLFDLRVVDEVSTKALMAAMMKVTTSKIPRHLHYQVGDLVISCLKNGVQSQQLINNALTQAIDSGCVGWAQRLNRDFQAVLDPQALEDYLWERLRNCPSNMNSGSKGRFVCDFEHTLTLADKENEQTSSAISKVLKRVLDGGLSEKSGVQECIGMLVEFNKSGSPDSKRKKS